MPRNEFSVCQFFANEAGYEYVLRHVDAQTAVNRAMALTKRGAEALSTIAKIIITDGGDYTCFEWVKGKGIVFPPAELTIQSDIAERS